MTERRIGHLRHRLRGALHELEHMTPSEVDRFAELLVDELIAGRKRRLFSVGSTRSILEAVAKPVELLEAALRALDKMEDEGRRIPRRPIK